MKICSFFVTVIAVGCSLMGVVLGQEQDATKLPLPECDIFLFDLNETDEGVTVSNGRRVIDRPGYDNQPWFTPGSKSFLYSANGKPDRTDIFEFVIESGEVKQITDSAMQEYSPQISPDNNTLSFVTDGKNANQSIWSEKRDGSGKAWLLEGMGEREPVGYYSWNRQNGYVLFWSRYGHSVKLYHGSKKISHYVMGNAIPSTPYVIPGTNNFSFMHRQGNAEVWIKELDPETLAVRPITTVKGSNFNYGWTPGGKLLMCDGTELFSWQSKDKGWQRVADLADHQMGSASRVAVSPDGRYLAVVGLPKK